MKPRLLKTIHALLLLLPALGQAALLPVTDDSYVFAGDPDTSFGTSPRIIVTSWGPHIGLAKFDLAPASGSSIDTATLSVRIQEVRKGGSLDLHRVNGVWNEDTLTFNTLPLIEAAPLVSIPVAESDVGSTLSVDITDLVQDWLDGSVANHGFALMSGSINVRLDSKETPGGQAMQIEVIESGGPLVIDVPSGDVEALIAAINTANSSGGPTLINLAAGTYTLRTAAIPLWPPTGLEPRGTGFPPISSRIHIRGAGANTTVIEREPEIIDPEKSDFRLFAVAASGDLTLEAVTLQKGSLPNEGAGAAVFSSGKLRVVDSTLQNNFAEDGGGCIFSRGTLVIENVLFSQCSGSDDEGGAIAVMQGLASIAGAVFSENRGSDGTVFVHEGIVDISASVFQDNFAERGGTGIYNYSGVVTLTDSRLLDGDAYDNGIGAGVRNEAGTFTIERSTIARNSAIEAPGGGIFNRTGSVVVLDSTLVDNLATYQGGGVYNDGGQVTVINSTLSGNRSDDGGGGVYNASGLVRLINSTVVRNSAAGEGPSDRGGGVANLSGTFELQNTLVAENRSEYPYPAGVVDDCSGALTSLGNNLIGEPGCDINLQPSDLTGYAGVGAYTASEDPGKGHVPLLADSPAIDAGNESACPDTDQLGNARVDGNGDGLVVCDIGAVEFVSAAPLCDGLVPTIVGTEGNDVIEGTDGPDVIHGLGGDDFILGGGGTDVICGGDGHDTIKSGGSADRVFGDAGNDELIGDGGDDTLEGGSGNDKVDGGDGDDQLRGNAGNDRLLGRQGKDVLQGGDGDDLLKGGGGSDSCDGGAGTDSAQSCEVTIDIP